MTEEKQLDMSSGRKGTGGLVIWRNFLIIGLREKTWMN